MSDSQPASANRAVFLSYASQDAEAVERIAAALRNGGVEVWFDKNELIGGDSWDAKIRGQISSCALFVPVISAATQARLEGYFRIEWKLAAQRTHAMAEAKPFLLPVVIDATRDAEAHVPGEFRAVQWTRLPGGEAKAAFCARVNKLLGGDAALAGSEVGARLARAQDDGRGPTAPLQTPSRTWLVAAILGVAAVAALAVWQPWRAKEKSASPASPAAALAPTAPLTEAQQLVAKARKVWEEGDEINRQTYALVEELLVRAEERDPAEASAWAFHAWVSAFSHGFALDPQSKRLETFRTQAERASKLASGTIEAELAAGALRFAMAARQGQDLSEPGRQLRELSAKYPNDPRVAELLGRSLSLMKNLDEATAILDQALARQPDNPRLKAALINAYYQNGRISEAEACVQRWIGGPTVGRIVTFDVHFKSWWRGDLKGATEAINQWPQWLLLEDRGIQRASLVYFWKRDATKLRQLAERFPRDYVRDTLFTGPRSVLIAWAHELAGRDQEATAEWRTTLQIAERELAAEPGSLPARYWRTWAQARLGDTVAAEAGLKLLEEDAAGQNSLTLITAGLAGLQITLGHLDVALATLQAKVGNAGSASRTITKAQLTLSPVFDPLRGDPRFQALIDAASGPQEKKANTDGSAALDPKSVAVLAFADNSPGRDSEYFSDGISEELINALGKVPGLKVPARTSSFYFKGKNVPVPEIAKQLGVAYVIEGSVQRMGEKVKILARLSKAADGFQVWTDSFLRDAKDVFAVEEEIAGLIAKQLSLKLGASSAAATASVNPEAFELYVKARRAWSLRIGANLYQAEDFLNQALIIEPKFARAHAALADVWLARGEDNRALSRYGQRTSPEFGRIAARINQALALDPDSAEAHASLGRLSFDVWDFDAAERELRRSIRLNSNIAPAHQWLGRTLEAGGRMDEALEELKRATELDPLAPILLVNYAGRLWQIGRFAESLALCDRCDALQPGINSVRNRRVGALISLGRTDEALALTRQVNVESSGEWSFMIRNLAAAGAKAEAAALLDKAPADLLFPRPLLLLGLDRRDEALASLNPNDWSSNSIGSIFFDPLFDSIRGESRFAKFLADLGLTDAHARAQAWRKAHPPEKTVLIKI